MKQQYKQIKQEKFFSIYRDEWIDRWHQSYIGKYDLKYSYCYRHVRTFNEIKQNHYAQVDGHHVRGKRTKKQLPSVWDDVMVSRVYGRSWKDYTKHRKQYMKNF